MFLIIEIIPAIFTSVESLIISFFLYQIFIKNLRIGIRTTGIIINLSIPGSISRRAHSGLRKLPRGNYDIPDREISETLPS